MLDAQSVASLPADAGVAPLQTLTNMLLPVSIREIRWSSQIYTTANFSRAIAGVVQSQCLRPVKSVLMFPDGSALLVSEREADSLIEVLWASGEGTADTGPRSSPQPSPLLLILSSIQQGFREHQLQRGSPIHLSTCLTMRSSRAWSTPPASSIAALGQLESDPGLGVLVGMQLFGGGTEYGTRKEREALHRLMRRKREAAEDLTEMRGRQSMFSRSDLEVACEEVLFDEK